MATMTRSQFPKISAGARLMPQKRMSNEERRAAMSRARGRLAAEVKDPRQRREFIAAQGKEEAAGRGPEGIELATALAEKKSNVRKYRPYGSPYKQGIHPDVVSYRKIK